VHNLDLNTFSIQDIVQTLSECRSDPKYESVFDHMLSFASELTGISEDTLCSLMAQITHEPDPAVLSAEVSDSANRTVNSKINYLYRDAGNYKVYNECVIVGRLTEAQKRIILSCLDEGEYFIPSLVGLPEVKFDEVDDPEVDHQWFELQEDGFEETIQSPTVFLSADDLVTAFCNCKDRWMDVYLGHFDKPALDAQIQSAGARGISVPFRSNTMQKQSVPTSEQSRT